MDLHAWWWELGDFGAIHITNCNLDKIPMYIDTKILLKDEPQGSDFMCCIIWNAYYVDVMSDWNQPCLVNIIVFCYPIHLISQRVCI